MKKCDKLQGKTVLWVKIVKGWRCKFGRSRWIIIRWKRCCHFTSEGRDGHWIIDPVRVLDHFLGSLVIERIWRVRRTARIPRQVIYSWIWWVNFLRWSWICTWVGSMLAKVVPWPVRLWAEIIRSVRFAWVIGPRVRWAKVTWTTRVGVRVVRVVTVSVSVEVIWGTLVMVVVMITRHRRKTGRWAVIWWVTPQLTANPFVPALTWRAIFVIFSVIGLQKEWTLVTWTSIDHLPLSN